MRRRIGERRKKPLEHVRYARLVEGSRRRGSRCGGPLRGILSVPDAALGKDLAVFAREVWDIAPVLVDRLLQQSLELINEPSRTAGRRFRSCRLLRLAVPAPVVLLKRLTWKAVPGRKSTDLLARE